MSSLSSLAETLKTKVTLLFQSSELSVASPVGEIFFPLFRFIDFPGCFQNPVSVLSDDLNQDVGSGRNDSHKRTG